MESKVSASSGRARSRSPKSPQASLFDRYRQLSGAGARAGRALDAHRLVASPTRSACARTAAARVRRFVEALALGQKIVYFREASTLSAQSEARSSCRLCTGRAPSPRRRPSK